VLYFIECNKFNKLQKIIYLNQMKF